MSTQPKRPRPSPAQQLAEARQDINRLTFELRQAMTRASIGSRKLDDILRAALTDLLHRDVIRIGSRPEVDEPIPGQTTIEEQLDEQ